MWVYIVITIMRSTSCLCIVDTYATEFDAIRRAEQLVRDDVTGVYNVSWEKSYVHPTSEANKCITHREYPFRK